MSILVAAGLMVVFCFSFVLLFGAPYLPTLKHQQQQAIGMLGLNKGDTLLELGCGDGRMLVTAAKLGINSVGYELNPIVFGLAVITTFKYRKNIKLIYGNFWHKKLPPAQGVYVFLHSRFMHKLDIKMSQQYDKTSTRLVSYAFAIPGKKHIKKQNALYLYEY
jgi:16S rRNA A1518/A1519 N6-dimethyltransferase RsmA/KsgA/DIM1 with predicted DNA glycosylase/AP lyase activity